MEKMINWYKLINQWPDLQVALYALCSNKAMSALWKLFGFVSEWIPPSMAGNCLWEVWCLGCLTGGFLRFTEHPILGQNHMVNNLPLGQRDNLINLMHTYMVLYTSHEDNIRSMSGKSQDATRSLWCTLHL
jgi:hypothetical protein